jgi:hypothetical protein
MRSIRVHIGIGLVICVSVVALGLAVFSCGGSSASLSKVNPEAALAVATLRTASSNFLSDPSGEATSLAIACAAIPQNKAALGVTDGQMFFLQNAVMECQLAAEVVIAPKSGATLDPHQAIQHANDSLDSFEKSVVEGWD